MSEFYADLQNTAVELLAEFGTTGQLVQKASRAVDPLLSTVSNDGDTSYPIVLAILPATNGTILGFEERLRDDFVSGKAKFAIIAAKDVPLPEIGDKVVISGVTHTVAGATPVDPTGVEAVIYNVGLRK